MLTRVGLFLALSNSKKKYFKSTVYRIPVRVNLFLQVYYLRSLEFFLSDRLLDLSKFLTGDGLGRLGVGLRRFGDLLRLLRELNFYYNYRYRMITL